MRQNVEEIRELPARIAACHRHHGAMRQIISLEVDHGWNVVEIAEAIGSRGLGKGARAILVDGMHADQGRSIRQTDGDHAALAAQQTHELNEGRSHRGTLSAIERAADGDWRLRPVDGLTSRQVSHVAAALSAWMGCPAETFGTIPPFGGAALGETPGRTASMTTTCVLGGVIVTGSGSHRADLVIRDGVVSGWHLDASGIDADETIDATGLLVLPGAIDVHTHFEEPDPNLLEGFLTGTMAAAAGGVTTVVEMPQAHPTTTTAEHLRQKRDIAERTSIVDMAFWGGVTLTNGQTPEDVRAMAAAGAVALKSFMASSSPFFPAVDTARLKTAMDIAADTGLPYGLHAEDDALLRDGIARLQAAGRTDALAHAESRPPIVETVAVATAIALAEETGAPVHICHVASAGALRLIADAKRRGVAITCETCPQYLVLDTDDLARLRGFGRCAPALRDRSEVEAIWAALLAGQIDLVCSDHCGFTVESKQRGDDDIFSVPNGLQGIQTLLPSLWSEGVNRRGMSPEMAVRLLSEAPARIFGLSPRKGSLAPGRDGDVVLLDPAREWTVTVEDHLHRQPWSPYAGMQMTARVVRTIRRGETIFDDARRGRERILAAPGSGQTLVRAEG